MSANGKAPGPPSQETRVRVLGVTISATTMRGAIETLAGWIASGEPHYVCVTGVHGVMESQGDEELRRIHNRSGMTVPDGMPMVWAGHAAGAPWMERVYGPDLMLAVCEAGLEPGWKHYFYGGGDGVAETLSDQLSARFPELRVVGLHTPPFRPLTSEESDRDCDEINDSGADIVWVGLSTPKQERWMAAHIDRLHRAQAIGVGAAFDINAGLLRQAPPWMQQRGLEWAFRLAVEPRRLWRRYLSNNPRFVVQVLRDRPSLESAAP